MSKDSDLALRYYIRRLKISDMSDVWQNILRREIHHTDDQECAARLEKAIAAETVSRNVLSSQTRPTVTEVELALRQGRRRQPDVRHVWERRLQRLYREKHKRTTTETLLDQLSHDHWLERFIARHVLAYRGGQTVPALSAFARKLLNSQKDTALWLLHSISRESTIRFEAKQDKLLCPQCYIRCAARNIDLPWQQDISYYGCRQCGQNQRFIHTPHPVVVVLDQNQPDDISHWPESLRISWYKHPQPFDFNQIEIINASDEAIERFAMRLGNDTDSWRKPRYATIPCRVAPDFPLSKNSARILESLVSFEEQPS